MSAIGVIVVDDDPVVGELVNEIVSAVVDLTLLGIGADGLEAVALAAEQRPDIALLDVNMPHGGADAVRAVLRVSPGTRVIAFSAHRHESSVLPMLEAGAHGYLLKGMPALELADSLRAVARGESVLSGPVAATVLDRYRDVSGRIRLMVERNERFESEKEEFIQILAHELLTPTAVMQASALTVDRFASGGDVDLLRELADRTGAAAQRLRRIVDDLTLAAQLRDDRWTPSFATTPLADLVTGAREVAAIGDDRLDLRGDEHQRIRTDPRLLTRALGLVLENAVDHADHVEVVIETHADALALCVRDDGPGFPSDIELSRSFSQGDSSTTRIRGGLGIGLYLTELIMLCLDGRIETGAAPGGGAEVRLILPDSSVPH